MSSPYLLIKSLAVLAFISIPIARLHSAPAQRQPVLVELFTSEGCSDCPPADALLSRLDQQQFVPGADAIVLSEHVTYWNHDGWRDPFSFSLMDERQQKYAQEFSLSSIYTPQAVVDGAKQLVGSDAAKLQAAIAEEAAKPKLPLSIENATIDSNGTIHFAMHLPLGSKGKLVAAVAQNATVSQVSRGENAGRTLHHVAVVRAMKEFSAQSSADGRNLVLALPSAQTSSSPLRLIVFLTDGTTGKVMGATEQPLRP